MKSVKLLWLIGLLAVMSDVGQNHAGATCFDGAVGGIDFSGGVLEPVVPLTELEQQILQLEQQLQNVGRATAIDESTFQQIKLQLNELYAQRPRQHDPLDDGADACPAVDMPTNIQPWSDTGSTVGAADDFAVGPPCTAGFAPDKIYRFAPANTGIYTFDTQGSDFDTYIYVRTGGACPGSSQIVCNDDFYGLQSRVQALLYGGQVYWLIIDGWANATGNFRINLAIECTIDDQPVWQHECPESVGDPLHSQYDCNGGCNNYWNGGFAEWQPINLCQILYGSCFTYQDANSIPARDTDYYYFTLTEPTQVAWGLYSTFSFNLQINEYGYCPAVNWVSLLNVPACTAGLHPTVCLPAGTYSLEITPNFYTGMPTPQPYNLYIGPYPCSGCQVEFSLIAPGLLQSSSCGSSDNTLRPSNDATVCVTIPYYADWTFSLCGGNSEWNSYLYLTSQCNGGIIAENDDACSGLGLSAISCVALPPGNYYVTIEGAGAADCGPIALSVTECQGACCYGDDYFNQQCSYGSLSACNALGGQFHEGQQCVPELCGVRAECEPNSVFSQQPHLPTELWTAVASDSYIGYKLWEDYSVPGNISSLRFWGLFTDYNNGMPCNDSPTQFVITFVDSTSGPAVQTFNVVATGFQIPQNYGANFPIYQYDVTLPTQCTISQGRISLQSTDGNACVWAWLSSPFGNSSVVLEYPFGAVDLPMDLSVCLQRGCAKPESLVIALSAPQTYDLMFTVVEASYVELLYSDSINAVYPATYQVIAAGSLTPGSWAAVDVTSSMNRRYITRAYCGPPPVAATPMGAGFTPR